jgi:hypothetical protein
VKTSTVKKLPGLASADAGDQELLGRVVDYYHATLKGSPEALSYLQSRGLEDAEMIEKDRRRLMRFYKSCLQRHIYATGPRKTLLTKNTPLSGRIDSVLAAFPDARIISIIRHPNESVPSHVSPCYQVWQVHSPEIAKDSPESKTYAMLAVQWYRHLFGNPGRFNRQRHICILYDDLVAQPVQTVERIYRHFGLQMNNSFRERLEKATTKSREYRSNHRYSLEEYGLSKEWIRQELGDLIDAYGLEKRKEISSLPHRGSPKDSKAEKETPAALPEEPAAQRA